MKILTILAFLGALLFTQTTYACTGFGAITHVGTIMGKNRDYFYVPQKFERITSPHKNSFYAITSAESVSMGVNQHGLTAIEEDAAAHMPLDRTVGFQCIERPAHRVARNAVLHGQITFGRQPSVRLPFSGAYAAAQGGFDICGNVLRHAALSAGR